MKEANRLLHIQGLSKRFVIEGDGELAVTPIRNLSFRVAAGEFVALVGPSGIGKSSILKCMYRTYLPTAGSIGYAAASGETIDLAQASERRIIQLRRREIGYVSQFLRVIPRVPAIGTVAERLIATGVERSEALRRAEELLDRLHIPRALRSAFPATFSGGEQQRINLARAFIVKPRLLILDEPTASLDRESKRRVIAYLQDLKKEGTTMVGVFHDSEVIEQAADRVLDIQQLNAH